MIIGKRTRLRAVEEEDLPLLARWINDPEISSLVVGWSFPISMAAQRAWFAKSLSDSRNQRWIVETLDGIALGLTGLWEIDWRNRHALTAIKLGSVEARGKGYATDAILTLTAYAFQEVGLNRLWTEILRFNRASYKAYVERCGWRVEGILRQHVMRHGSLHDVLRVAILQEEFRSNPAAASYIERRMDDALEIDVTKWAAT